MIKILPRRVRRFVRQERLNLLITLKMLGCKDIVVDFELCTSNMANKSQIQLRLRKLFSYTLEQRRGGRDHSDGKVRKKYIKCGICLRQATEVFEYQECI